MSLPQTPLARRGAPATLMLPRASDPVTAAQINTLEAVIEQYEQQRQARQVEKIPVFTAIRLVSPNGTTYELRVLDNGGATIQPVPRPTA